MSNITSRRAIHLNLLGDNKKYSIGFIWLSLLLLLSNQACAAFSLESTGIILYEQEGRVSFNIRNPSSDPILLVSKLSDLDGGSFSKEVLISPPITRIDGEQSQQINFVLKKGAPLRQEVLLKASFEGVTQTKDNSAKMPVRQEIGFLIVPASVAQSKTPWKDLQLHMEGKTLVISNPGKHVIRLAPQLRAMPSKQLISLDKYYLMPGDIKRLSVSNKPTSVIITPLSRYGFKLPDEPLEVK